MNLYRKSALPMLTLIVYLALVGCAGPRSMTQNPSDRPPQQTVTTMANCQSGATKFALHYEGDPRDRLSGYRYRIHMKDGTLIEGVTNERGETSVTNCEAGEMAQIEVLGRAK